MQHCRRQSLPIIWDQGTYTSQGQGDLWEEQARFGYQTGIAMALHLPEGRHFLNPLFYTFERHPVVKVPPFEFATRSGPGTRVYSTVKAYRNGKLIGVSQPSPAAVAPSGYLQIPTPIPRVAKAAQYVVSFELPGARRAQQRLGGA